MEETDHSSNPTRCLEEKRKKKNSPIYGLKESGVPWGKSSQLAERRMGERGLCRGQAVSPTTWWKHLADGGRGVGGWSGRDVQSHVEVGVQMMWGDLGAVALGSVGHDGSCPLCVP